MSDGPYERMLRDADPYRHAVARDLDGAAGELLAQIVSEPTGRTHPFRLAGVGVAAAALIALAIVPTTWNRTPAPPAAPPASVQPSAAASPPALLEPAKARKAAEQGPRLLLGEPGWKIIHLEPFGERMGEMAYEKGRRSLMLVWYPAAEYDQRRLDRRSGKEKVTVGGVTGYLVADGGRDFTVVTEPRDGVFAELQAGLGWTRAGFRTLLAGMRHVDVATWVASSSPQITRSGEAGDRAARLLMDMPRPPKWNPGPLAGFATGGTYQFDTALAKRVTCDWLTEWQRATNVGDTAARSRAGNALLSSRNWKVLKDLEQQGSDLRRSLTTMADRVAGGTAAEAEVTAYRASMC